MTAYVISIVLEISGNGNESLVGTVEVAALVCWILFGIGLWSSQAAEEKLSLIA